MKKKIVVLSAAFMLGINTFISAPAVKAESINELEHKKSSVEGQRTVVQKDIEKAVEQLARLKGEQIELAAQLKRIDQAIVDNTAQIADTEKKIKRTEKEITVLEKEIDQLQKRIEERNEILKKRAVALQEKGGSVNYMEVLLGSSGFADLISRVSAVTTLVEADKLIMDEHEADKKALQEKQDSVKKKLSSLTDMKMDLVDMLAQIKDQKKKSKSLSKQVAKKQKQTQNIMAKLKEKDAGLASQAKQLAQDIYSEKQLIAAEKAAKEQRERDEALKKQLEQEKALKEQQESKKADEKQQVRRPQSSGSSDNETKKPAASPVKKPEQKQQNAAPAPVGRNVSTAVYAGNKYIGRSVYVFGGGRTQSDIDRGRFDCSGFVHWAYSQAGINLGSRGSVSTATLKNYGTRISYSNIKPGDMVFFDTNRTDGHVGIYVGGGRFIGSQSSTGVAIANMTSGYWAGKFKGHVRRL